MKKAHFNRLMILAVSWYVSSCVYRELPTGFDCTTSSLAITLVSSKDATSCKSIDGTATMSATGGVPPYDFSLGDGVYQTNPVFDRLAPGSYLITVKDTKGCKASVKVDLGADNSNLTAQATSTPDDQCFADSGTITVTASDGTAPYFVKIDNGTFGPATSFSSLKNGNHTVIVKDAADCQRVLIVPVARGATGTSYAKDIAPIFTANCNFSGCHGTGTTGRDWTNFTDVKNNATDIKARTGNRSMPIGDKTLTQQQIQLIACWVDDGANDN